MVAKRGQGYKPKPKGNALLTMETLPASPDHS